MAITASLVTALGGGNIDYVPITPNARDFKVTLPAGTWLVQFEMNNTNSSNAYTATVGGVDTRVVGSPAVLLRVVSGGTLTGSTNNNYLNFTHGIAIRLGD